MMQRQFFDVSTDTGTWTDSGPAFMGEIAQLRWEAISGGDTGDDLTIYLQQRPGDTGNGILIGARAASLAADFFALPRRLIADTGLGAATGADTVISANEHLRVKVTPGGATVVGRLYIWTRDN